MTTITDTRTFTDRALEASADRIVALAAASGRPHRRDEDLAVVWQGDRGDLHQLRLCPGHPR